MADTKIPALHAHPKVSACDARISAWRKRLAELDARERGLREEVALVSRGDDPAALAERVRRGEAFVYKAPPDTSAQEAELRAVAQERAVLTLAVSQEGEALDAAVKAALADAEEAALPLAGAHDAAAASALLAFAVARGRRAALSLEMAQKGYQDLAVALGAAGPLAELGSLSDPQSPISVRLRLLEEAGLLPRGSVAGARK